MQKPVLSGDLRSLFQALSRMAVATSCGLGAGCSESVPASGQPEGPDHTPGDGATGDQPIDAAPQHTDEAGQPWTETADAMARADSGEAAPDAGPADDAAALPPGAWVELECSAEGEWPFEDTNFAQPVDYFAQYTPYFPPDEPGTLRFSTSVLHGGSACEGATDELACLAAVEQQLDAIECAAEPCSPFVLVTAGDTVTRVQTRAEFMALFGPLDTEIEAAIVALHAGGSAGCWHALDTDAGLVPAYGTRVRAVDGGYEVETHLNCYGATSIGTTMVSTGFDARVLTRTELCIGRRPEGLVTAPPCPASSELGAHFASAAQLEAASVFAFDQLARDLARLGAPRELVLLALRAALDEVDHARRVGALATRFGGEVSPARVTPTPGRDALAIALENAVEGCLRETYGALLACHQAKTARDPQVRAVMARLFEDETRHAELAWKIARWLEPRLSEAERKAVQLARRAAYAQLRSELEASLSPDARVQAGMPDVATSVALLAQLDRALDLQAA